MATKTFNSEKVNNCVYALKARNLDNRGYLEEILQEDRYRQDLQIFGEWRQTNFIKSMPNALRGLRLVDYGRYLYVRQDNTCYC